MRDIRWSGRAKLWTLCWRRVGVDLSLSRNAVDDFGPQPGVANVTDCWKSGYGCRID